jgi:hypothetical protein
MAAGVSRKRKGGKSSAGMVRAAAWLALLLPIASCVPTAMDAPHVTIAVATPTQSPPVADTSVGLGDVVGLQALTANAALQVSSGFNPAASAYVFRAATPLDQMRSLDCLAQAVYYEAGNQSDDGQRAVAQVVLNRVRHPAWPKSVCGVVYQGPLRAGGGCQFTFTCDGSLGNAPGGMDWARARRIAADALAGYTFAPVGLATHYHANYVYPAWAPHMVKVAEIGAHEFYRLPGLAGAPGAFTGAYAGNEPVPHPAAYLPFLRRDAAAAIASAQPAAPAPPPIPSDIPQQARWAATAPESTVREEYRQSGQWRDDAPASVTGGR